MVFNLGHRIVILSLLAILLAGCQTPDLKKAAQEALKTGLALDSAREIERSVPYLKEAERLGLLANDSFTVARAEHIIAWQMLNCQHTESEDTTSYYAIELLKNADVFYRDDYTQKAKVQGMMAMLYFTAKEYDKAEEHIQLAVEYANISDSNNAKRFVWRYYSVICREQGRYGETIACLRNIMALENPNKHAVVDMDMAKAFYLNNEMDSAAHYFHRMEAAEPWDDYGDEFKMAAYNALSVFYENQGETALALQYIRKHEEYYYEIAANNANRSVYDIQQKYDFESLENQKNKEIVQKQRIIMIVSFLLLIAVALVLLLQLKQKQVLKQDAEMKRQLDALKSKMIAAAFTDEPVCRQILESVENQVFKTKVNCSVYKDFALTQAQLNALRDAVETHFPSFTTNLQARYPELTNDDLDYCHLYLLGLNEAQISALMQKSYTAVSDRSRKLRKIFGTDQMSSVFRSMTQN